MKQPSRSLRDRIRQEVVSDEEFEMLQGIRAMQERIEQDGGTPRLLWFVVTETSDPEMLEAQKKLIADLMDP